MRTLSLRRCRGFSLLELAVVLVIAALITSVALGFIPLGKQVLSHNTGQQQLIQAEQAMLGHLRGKLSLPAADTDGDGKADAGATAGWLPARDLGLSAKLRILYQVQPGLLTPPVDLFVPQLAGAYAGTASTTPNALDLCLKLFGMQTSAPVLPGLGSNAAYVLGSGDGSPLSGTAMNAAAALRLPGTGDTDASRTVQAAGIGELASRLSCSDRVARAQGAAQTALAAYSVMEVTNYTSRFRRFDERTAKVVLVQAETGLASAVTGLAFAIFDESIAIVLTAAGLPPDPLGIAIGIGEHVTALASIAYAAYSLDLAKADMASAKDGIQAAGDALVYANQQRDRAIAMYDTASRTAIALDQSGIDK